MAGLKPKLIHFLIYLFNPSFLQTNYLSTINNENCIPRTAQWMHWNCLKRWQTAYQQEVCAVFPCFDVVTLIILRCYKQVSCLKVDTMNAPRRVSHSLFNVLILTQHWESDKITVFVLISKCMETLDGIHCSQ